MSRYALLLVEGDTEIIFYKRLKQVYFPSAQSKTINLYGNWNINTKILDVVSSHASDNPVIKFSVYICIDRESRDGKAPINLEQIKEELACYQNIDQQRIELFEAIQDIESWFLHDIDGIYKFLRVPSQKRNPTKYRPVERCKNTSPYNLIFSFSIGSTGSKPNSFLIR